MQEALFQFRTSLGYMRSEIGLHSNTMSQNNVCVCVCTRAHVRACTRTHTHQTKEHNSLQYPEQTPCGFPPNSSSLMGKEQQPPVRPPYTHQAHSKMPSAHQGCSRLAGRCVDSMHGPLWPLIALSLWPRIDSVFPQVGYGA